MFIVNILTVEESPLNAVSEIRIASSTYEEAKKIFEEEKRYLIDTITDSHEDVDIESVIREDFEDSFKIFDNYICFGGSVKIFSATDKYLTNTF